MRVARIFQSHATPIWRASPSGWRVVVLLTTAGVVAAGAVMLAQVEDRDVRLDGITVFRVGSAADIPAEQRALRIEAKP